MAVKHGPCLLTLKKRINSFETKCLGKLLRISYLEHIIPTTGCKINFLVGREKPPLRGYCQETETGMVRACHTPRQPLQNHPSWHLGGWATPWSAVKMVDGRHQRLGIPANTRTAHNGLLKKGWKRISAESSVMPLLPSPHFHLTTQSVKGLKSNELKLDFHTFVACLM